MAGWLLNCRHKTKRLFAIACFVPVSVHVKGALRFSLAPLSVFDETKNGQVKIVGKSKKTPAAFLNKQPASVIGT